MQLYWCNVTVIFRLVLNGGRFIFHPCHDVMLCLSRHESRGVKRTKDHPGTRVILSFSNGFYKTVGGLLPFFNVVGPSVRWKVEKEKQLRVQACYKLPLLMTMMKNHGHP
jgi:hypothetical protein